MRGRDSFAKFELVAAIVYLVASLGFVANDIMFGYLVLLCFTPGCLAWQERPDLTYLSAVLFTTWSALYLVDAGKN